MSNTDTFSGYSKRLQWFFRGGPATLYFAGRRTLRPIQRLVMVSVLAAFASLALPQAMAQANTPVLTQKQPSRDETRYLPADIPTATGHSDRDPDKEIEQLLHGGLPVQVASATMQIDIAELEQRDTPPIPTRKPTPPLKDVPADFSEGILIDISDRRLYWVIDGKEARSFSIAVPREGYRTYYGDSSVGWLRPNPTWTPTPNMRRKNPKLPASVPPGPNNPLGTKAIGTGWKYIYIHGTNRPDSIGTRASSGCFRMHNADVEWLFEQVERGTPIRVQP